jgi:hypothetical protein
MATQMTGKVRRARKVDPNGNIYYDRGVSDIIFDPERGISVKQDIDNLRAGLKACLEFVAANPKGMDGKSAYQIALDHGFEGTEYDWLYSLTGDPGRDGLSAYEIAVVYLGFEGTEEDFIASLKGEKGDKGDSGYDIAVRNGYEGTEEEWINSNMQYEEMTEDEVEAIYDEVLAKHNSYDGGDGYVSLSSLSDRITVVEDEMGNTIIKISADNGDLDVTHYDGTVDVVPVAVRNTDEEVQEALDSVDAEDSADV